MLRNGYPRMSPPHDWARRPEGALPADDGRVVLGQWISEHGDTLTIHQHDPPERERKRFSVVWEPAGGEATRTIWGSSVDTTRMHLRRTFERVRARHRE